MKILVISNLYKPNIFGGYERLCTEVAEELLNLGHDISVLTSSYGNINATNDAYPIFRKLSLFASANNLYRPFECSEKEWHEKEQQNINIFDTVVNEIQPDVLFIWNLYFLPKSFFEHINRTNFKKIYLLTDNWLIALLNPKFINCYFGQLYSDKERNILTIFQDFVQQFKRRNVVIDGHAILPSKFMLNLYKQAGLKFSDKQSICYHGVEFTTDYVPHNCSLNNDCVNLLFAGRIDKIKGVHVAIKSLPEIIRNNPNKEIRLNIVGDLQNTDYVHELKELCASLNVISNVKFNPAVDISALRELFNENDIYIFPSLYEPFSLTLIYALESGIPTVASDIGGNVEIIDHCKTGLLFESKNSNDLSKKIQNLIDDEDLRYKISKAAHDRASKFTFSRLVHNINNVIAKASK